MFFSVHVLYIDEGEAVYDWSEEKPVLYFTDGSQMTGNLENIVQVLTEDLKSSQKVLQLKEGLINEGIKIPKKTTKADLIKMALELNKSNNAFYFEVIFYI